MENSYGIGVRNRYELFYDEDVDPLDLIKQTESKKKDKSAEKENKVTKTAKTKETVPAKKNNKSENSQNTPNERPTPQVNNKHQSKSSKNNESHVKFSDREERNNRKNKSVEIETPEKIETVKENRENRENVAPPRFDGETRGRGGRGFGRGARGGGRGSRGGNRTGPTNEFRGKREYDRQSGMVTSGVKPVDKREGSGPFNWGSNKDPITDEQLQADNADLDTSGENVEKPPEEPVAPTTDEETLKEEEGSKEMTLDEWKALQKREKPIFKTRRAGEGENTSQWKKTYVLKKKIDEGHSSEEAEEGLDEAEAHHGRKKVLLPIDFQFADTPTRGRGRGGRGRGGPGRGRGMGGRGRGSRFNAGRDRQEAPKMDDERDFPSLG